MAAFFSKRRTTPRDEAEPGELNIVPYLDILMNLIIFVLLSMTGLASFGSLNVTANTRARSGEAAVDAQPFAVRISTLGHSLSVGGSGLPMVPTKPDGSFDYEGLNARARQYRSESGAGSKVIISADASIPFEVVVTTMDAVRETVDHQSLFRDITLSPP